MKFDERLPLKKVCETLDGTWAPVTMYFLNGKKSFVFLLGFNIRKS
jgi:hypothetical protein